MCQIELHVSNEHSTHTPANPPTRSESVGDEITSTLLRNNVDTEFSVQPGATKCRKAVHCPEFSIEVDQAIACSTSGVIFVA